MKDSCSNKLFLLLLAIALLASCSKASLGDEELPDNSTSADANLVVSISQIEQRPFITTISVDSATCTRLNFAVYNLSGTRLKQFNQKAGESSFGTASFQLEPGTYRLVVLAHSSNGNPTMTDPAKIQFKNSQGFTDTFLYYATVSVAQEQQTLNVSLDRIVSMCRFVINDAIPDEVTRLEFYYTGGSGAFNAATRLGCVASKQDVKFDVTTGQSWTEYDLYTFLHKEEDVIHLTVTALDAADNVVGKRELELSMRQNQITWATGYFFEDQPSDSWTVIPMTSLDKEWNNEIYIRY